MIQDVLLSLSILLFLTKIFGEISERIGLSSITGEVLVGILLGPSVLNIVAPNEFIEIIAMLGVLSLLFLAGLSTAFDSLNDIYKATIIALFSGILSLVLTFSISRLFGLDTISSIVVGVALISTSISVSIRTLTDIGEIYSKSVKTMVSASVGDDILAILALSLLMGYVNVKTITGFNLLKMFLIVIGFYVIVLNLGSLISRKMTNFFASMKDEQGLISMALVTMLFISIIADKLNITILTGAFLAGMMLAKSEYSQSIIPKLKVIGHGFLIPIFFAYVGINVNINAISSGFYLLIAIFLAEAIAKFLGGYYGSKFAGMESSEAIKIGAGLIPMGEYTLITAFIALTMNVIEVKIYSILICIVFLTNIITPRVLRFAYS
ncbi:MAG: cation:proton antiporter [Candidatus Parvarchaeota archaeon]|nr:cation:proton antiporter [Candidatus Jingweiarchaeum tengchongense]MCW1298106.1 cation:proton antiporter [Candidatus Jingweiarchaeum tengchongense]MCW1300714.1 cation:proton antiporter [Candidatus Jingweiarchaeum tengchongense]MCW1305141.1 cation:proton antiporter [Candidatus Jingweiarchaeum tengchongense]MCW1305528.1 cation:proton antiporter [Candidatus Jingweiarchaeum tengchongense]